MKKFVFTLTMIACISIMVQAQNFKTVPVLGGVSTVLAKYPFNMSYGYSRIATIYNKADIGGSGTIYKVAFVTDAAQTEATIPIKIKFKYSSTPSWGGTGTYAALSTGATTVYSGGYHFNSGVNYITLQTPFDFTLNVNHLIVFFEMDYGGTGSASPINFVCKPIDSGIDYFTHFWYSNNTAPTTNGQLIDYQPLMMLIFDSPAQPLSITQETACSGNNISWQKNANNDMVIVVSKLGNSVTNGPQCFGNYAAGDSLGFGSYVVYAGSALTSTLHTPVAPGQLYYYRAWSYSTDKIFSETDISGSVLSAYNSPYTQNFDGGSGLPNGWTGSMAVMPDHGATDQGLVAQLQSPNVEKNVSTPVFCNINLNSILEFEYRIVNIAGYPTTATLASEMDSVIIKVSTDNGHNYTTINSITQANHIASLNFATKQISLASYATQAVKIQFKCKRGNGEYFVDIDNFKIIDASGVEDQMTNNIELYPNPASNSVFINIPDGIGSKLQCDIYNSGGQLMSNVEAIESGTNIINVSSYSPGVYYVVLISEQSRMHLKFVKF